MSLSPLTFTGISQFSTDFQTILDRAVRIAQLPVQALQNRTSDVLQQKTLLSGLASGVSSLAAALEKLGETAAQKALKASSSKPAVVTPVNAGATAAAAYTIESVSSVAAAASERTLAGYADSAATPVGSTGDFRLVVGGEEYNFTLANNTLVGLRDKINSLGAGVTASILTTAGGNYLSVSANASGETTLRLVDDPEGANADLLTGTNQGTDLVFHLNGIEVRQASNLVNGVVPGLTFTVLDTSVDPVQLSLAADQSQLASAISGFVASFNSLRSQLNAQTGAAAGLLTGNTVVTQLSGQLRQIAAHRALEGSVKSLADLGITFDSNGTMSFDEAALNALTQQELSDAFEFLGGGTGLGSWAAGLRQFSDPVTGLIKLEQNGLDRIDGELQKQIAARLERIDVMRRGMAAKLQQADALLAALDRQQSTIKASLQGLNVVLYGKQRE